MRKNSRLGRKFGRLTTQEWLPKAKSYRCICDCGNTKVVKSAQLGWGVNSCGCLKKEEYLRRGGGPKNIRLNEIWRYYRRNATVRNLPWELTKEQFGALLVGHCHYCGGKGSLGFNFTGLDRLENTQGYILGNVVPCCKRCNQARNDMTVDEFLQWITKVYNWNRDPRGE